MGRDLDKTCRFGKIDGCVADFGEEDGVYFRVVLKVLKDTHSLKLGCPSMNIEFS